MRRITALVLLAAWSAHATPPPSAQQPSHAGINHTGLALQQRMFDDPTRNEVMSPASISVAFAMLAAGANGETADELYAFLHHDRATADATLGGMVRGWNAQTDDAPVTLRVANRVWLSDQLPVNNSYLRVTRDHYGAQAVLLDFAGSPDGSRQIINDWVEEQTEDRIQDLIPSGALSAASKLVLTNAVYFNADWSTAFDTDLTRDATFTTGAGETVRVATMHAERSMATMEDDNARMVMLPYDGGTADFLIVLPKGQSLAALQSSMTPAMVDEWVGKTQPELVDLSLPKFEFTANYASMAQPLATLGVRLALSPRSDLTGVSSADKVEVSDAIHKAFIRVDESGTEAAAATAILLLDDSEMPPRTVPFHVDQPFWFAVRDRATGTLLFTGQVADPSAESE